MTTDELKQPPSPQGLRSEEGQEAIAAWSLVQRTFATEQAGKEQRLGYRFTRNIYLLY